MATPTYRGMSFPFRRTAAGFPAPATDDELIWESIVQLLSTAAGERVMRPDTGSLVERLLFENDDALLAQLIATDVSSVLARYEPRILLRDVRLVELDRDRGVITLQITYIRRSTGTESSRSLTLTGTSA